MTEGHNDEPMPPELVRDATSAIGRIVGKPDLTDDILSGRMDANDVSPLLAGMIDAAIRTAFGPVAGMTEYDDFDPTERPMKALITLLDGSQIRVTVDALPKKP
jgi:hypothetical protein